MKLFFMAVITASALILLGAVEAKETSSVKSLVLDAVHDSYVVTDISAAEDPQGLRDQNFGKVDFIKVWYASRIQAEERIVSLGLVSFDLTPLKDIRVTSANVQMYAQRVDIVQPARLVDINLVQGDWNEADVTYNKRPVWSPEAISTTVVYGAERWYTWDITPTFAANPAEQTTMSFVLGLRTLDDKSEEQSVFNSHESATNKPRLVVTYQADDALPTMYFWIGGIVGAVVISLILGKILFGRGPKVSPAGGGSSAEPPSPPSDPGSGTGGSGTTRRPRTPRTPPPQ